MRGGCGILFGEVLGKGGCRMEEEKKTTAESEKKYTEDGYELPDFIDGEDEDIIKIG